MKQARTSPSFAVRAVELPCSSDKAVAFIRDPANLPLWTNAFAKVADGKAIMRTPAGETEVKLKVVSSPEHGTVDWHIEFPDGSVASAFSRVTPIGADRSAYSFVLMSPPAPLERLEGALQEQSRTLAEELEKLRALLGGRR